MAAITPELIKLLALEGDDFGFEMRVQKVLRQARSATIEHGGTHTDPIRGEPRQFDFGFEIFNRTGDSGFRASNQALCVQLAVECKNVFSQAPVVVCGCPRTSSESYHEIIASAHGALRDVRSLRMGYVSRTLRVPRSPLFPTGQFVGKSIGKVKPPKREAPSGTPRLGYVLTNDADLFDPWSQAVAHAVTMGKSACENTKKNKNSPTFTITIPIVVVPDGALWTISYDDDGNVCGEPTTTEACQVYRGQRFTLIEQIEFRQHLNVSHFQFCTVSGLATLVRRLQDCDSLIWDSWFHEGVISEFTAKLGPG